MMEGADHTRRSVAAWPLGALLVGIVLVPALILAVLGWRTWDEEERAARTTVNGTAAILYEHAVKVLETHRLVLREAAALVRDLSDDEIRADEATLHGRLSALVADLPQVQSVFVHDARGYPILSATVYPVPHDAPSIATRDFFAAQVEGDAGLYVSRLWVGSVDGQLFFNVTVRRQAADGRFLGTVSASIRPDYFQDFYRRTVAGIDPGLAIALVRADGTLLLRHPVRDARDLLDAPKARGLLKAIAVNPLSGTFEAVSSFDRGRPLMVAYRALATVPLYVTVSLPRESVLAAWRARMLDYVALALPATACLFLLAFVAVRRTTREQAALARAAAEAERREAAEGSAQQARRMEALGLLAARVAHDFNNLLSVIGGSAEIAARKIARGDDPAGSLAAVERAVAAGEGLTRKLLAFARRERTRPEPVDLADLLPRLAEPIQRIAGPGVTTRMRIEQPRHGRLMAVLDPLELEMAVFNLAANARDAMPAGGTIEVAARRLDEAEDDAGPPRLELRISDTGEGMPAEIVRRAFEPFFTTKEGGQGTCLGLSQVYGFVTQAGGDVAIRSAPGMGTEIVMRFPAAPENGAAATADRVTPGTAA